MRGLPILNIHAYDHTRRVVAAGRVGDPEALLHHDMLQRLNLLHDLLLIPAGQMDLARHHQTCEKKTEEDTGDVVCKGAKVIPG